MKENKISNYMYIMDHYITEHKQIKTKNERI